MYDIQRIGKIIADIAKYQNELESYHINTKVVLGDNKTYHASSMVVFALLNRVIDIGSEMLSAENLGAPNTYQDIMPLLAKANILNKEQAEKLNRLIRKRNVLAHFYQDMDEKELYQTIQELSIINDFLKIVKKRMIAHENNAS